MPKQKTNRGAAKRFQVSKTGKIKFRRMNRNHFFNKKSNKRMRHLRKGGYVSDADAATIRELIPYK